MFKAVLCLIIIMSSGALGILKSMSFNQRIKDLDNLRTMIHQLSIEISYMKDPLISIFHRISDQDNGISSKLLEKCIDRMNTYSDFSQCWSSAVKEVFENTSMKKEDKFILIELGSQLGKSGIEGQADILHLTEEKLKRQIELACRERDSKGKMFGSLGFSIGIVISVLLI